jgi:hypothetical protein
MLRPIKNTSPFLGLHAKATGACNSLRTRDACTSPQTQKKITLAGDRHVHKSETDIGTTRPNQPSGSIW